MEAALIDADVIVIAPSNPFLSIDPLLSVPGVEESLSASRAPVLAISPIIGGEAVKGPAADILRTLWHDNSALGVAQLYAELADIFILDEVDASLAAQIETTTGLKVVVLPTLMTDIEAKQRLAASTLRAALGGL